MGPLLGDGYADAGAIAPHVAKLVVALIDQRAWTKPLNSHQLVEDEPLEQARRLIGVGMGTPGGLGPWHATDAATDRCPGDPPFPNSNPIGPIKFAGNADCP